MRYISFIYIRQGAYYLKKVCASTAPCVSKPQEAFAPQWAFNNYEFMVHHVSIYRKRPKDFNEEKKPIIF